MYQTGHIFCDICFGQKSPSAMSTPYYFGQAGCEICRWNNAKEHFLPKIKHQLEPSNSLLRFWLGRMQRHKTINNRHPHHDKWGTGVMNLQKADDDIVELCQSSTFSTIYMWHVSHPLTSLAYGTINYSTNNNWTVGSNKYIYRQHISNFIGQNTKNNWVKQAHIYQSTPHKSNNTAKNNQSHSCQQKQPTRRLVDKNCYQNNYEQAAIIL